MSFIESGHRFPTERHKKVGDNIFVYEDLYRGTPEDLAALVVLSQTPEFQEQYPDHAVFADRAEIVGARRRNPDPENITKYFIESSQLIKALNERGITTFDCALIQTGPASVDRLGPRFSTPGPSAPTR